MEPDILRIAISLIAGTALGLFYFGLLWVTARSIPRVRNPGFLVLGSFVGRSAVVLTGFYIVMNGRWERLAACLLGFLVVRHVMVARIRPYSPAGAISDPPRPREIRRR